MRVLKIMMVKGDVKIQELPTVTNIWDLGLMGLLYCHKNIIQHLELDITLGILISCLHIRLMAEPEITNGNYLRIDFAEGHKKLSTSVAVCGKC